MNSTFLSCIDSKVEHPTNFYGRFEIGPFAPGQGLTVANALRRSLLSQLPGAALTFVEIHGASHEYETLPGVRESVLDILLNLKQIVLTSDFDVFTPQLGVLKVKGPGVVRARDLKLPSFIYSIDPDQYIATLTESGQLNMKFLVSCGKNHLTHTPSHMDFSHLVSLLKQTQPTVNYDNSFQDDQMSAEQIDIELIKSTDLKNAEQDKKKASPLVGSKNSSKVNLDEKTIGDRSSKSSELNKQKPTINFYQKWKSERLLIQDDSFKFGKDQLKLTSNQLTSNKQSPKLHLSNSSFQQENAIEELKSSVNSLFESEKDIQSNFSAIGFLQKTGCSNTPPKDQQGFKPVVPTTLQEKSKSRSVKIGYFPIDAIFMPVTRVNYLIDSNTEHKLAKETILLEVWTNGSVHPRHAIHKAAKALIQLFLPLQQMKTSIFQVSQNEKFKPFQNHIVKESLKSVPPNFSKNSKVEINSGSNGLINFQTTILNGTQKSLNLNSSSASWEAEIRQTASKQNDQLLKLAASKNQNLSETTRLFQNPQKILELDIANLDLTSRPYSLLKQANINTISELISTSKQELLEIKNFGQRSLTNVEKALNLLGLQLDD